MRKMHFTACLVALCFAFAATGAEFIPALEHGGRPIAGFQLFRAGKVAMVYLNPDYGQFGSAVIRFPELQPPGKYRIDLSVSAPEPDAAAVGFYLLLESGDHLLIRGKQTATPGKTERLQLTIRSGKPVAGFIVKKMEKRRAASVAVGDVRVTVKPAVELPVVPFVNGHVESFRISELETVSSERFDIAGKCGVGLNAERYRFNWSTVELDRIMPAGNYDFAGEILSPSADAAEVALYILGADGVHAPIGGTLQPAEKVGAVTRQFSFAASSPFSMILVKKMGERKTASVALGDFTLTMRPERRLAALNEVLRYPAPYGIASASLARDVAAAVASGNATEIKQRIPETEAWLDAAALAADTAAELTVLQSAARTLFPGRFDLEQAKLRRTFDRVRALLEERKLEEAVSVCDSLRRDIATFHDTLNHTAGGEVNPDYGSDIYGWVKNFEIVTKQRFPEYGEPTPYRFAGPDGLRLCFRNLGEGGVLESNRTMNRYTYDDAVFTFSVLTGVVTIDVKQQRFSGKITGKSLQAKRISNHAFALSGSGSAALLVMSDRGIGSVAVENGALTIQLTRPGRIGLLFTRSERPLDEIAAYYAQRLNRLPVELVQIERNGEIEQRILDHAGRSAAFFPVSPLLELGRTAPRPVATEAVFDRAPDGQTVLAGNPAAFRYRLPERTLRTERGINVFEKPDNAPELFRELKRQGCEVVRLACGTATRWDWAKPELMRDALVHNLKLIAESGLKAGIDLHNSWHPGKEFGAFDSPEYRAEFLKRWSAILEWAAPYRTSIAWYDLMNEPMIFREATPVTPYWTLIATTLPELRKLDPDTPFLVEVANMANPVGAWDWPGLDDPNVIFGFHDYWPHMFTHQKVQERGSTAAADVHYPGFMPMITWSVPSWRNEDEHWAYWDRWKAENVDYPVLRVLTSTGMPADCGELGVVGYAGNAKYSGRIWLADAIRRMKRMGVSCEVWGVHGGYVWNVPPFKDEVLKQWAQQRDAQSSHGNKPAGTGSAH